MQPTTSKYIEVRESSIHNKGIFAAINIPKDTKIIEYVGKKITKKEADNIADNQFEKGEEGHEGHVYLFELDSKHDIDGNTNYNTAKYINHSCDPNCETENEDGHIWIVAIKNIKKGDELSYNYGYDLESFKDHPCKCGSKNCVGYIVKEEDRTTLKKKLQREKSKAKRKKREAQIKQLKKSS